MFLLQIVNICSNDGQRLFDAIVVGNFVLSSIILMVAVVTMSGVLVGWGAVIGVLATFFLFYPLQVRGILIVYMFCGGGRREGEYMYIVYVCIVSTFKQGSLFTFQLRTHLQRFPDTCKML